MRTLLIILVLAAAVVGVLFALGILGGDTTTSTPDTPDIGTTPAPDGNGEGESALLTGPAPTETPDVEELPLIDPLNVLMLAGVPERLNLFLAQSLTKHPKMKVLTWAPALGASEVPPPETLPGAVGETPTADIFRDEEIDVLLLHDVDPSLLDDAFWQAVDERVRADRLGLYIQPGIKHGAAMLAHPVLSALAPAEDVRAFEGSPLPGVFGRAVAFDLTEDGASHPATRLVPWPKWSKVIWEERTKGEFPWGTSFCYPVAVWRDGSVVLLTCQAPRQSESYAALVAGPSATGRVLFNAAWELGSRQAYGRPATVHDWEKLVRNWVIFLGGRDV